MYLNFWKRSITGSRQQLKHHHNQNVNAKRLERTALILDEIKRHFGHQKSFLSHMSNEQDAECLKKCQRSKTLIDAVDSLLMSHVDDADFREELRKLLVSFDTHLKHYSDTQFAGFRQQLSPQELRNMDSRPDDWMLGSAFGSRF